MNSTLIKLVIIQIKEFIREPEILFWSILFPIGISGVLGLAFTQQSEVKRNVGVVESKGINLQQFQRQLDLLDEAKFKTIKCSEKEALIKLKRGEIQLYIKKSARWRF